MHFDLADPAPRLLVVGDLMIDHYLWSDCNRISPEAPVPVLDVQRETETLGGAGNVVANLLALGAAVDVASVVGADAAGATLAQLLAQAGATPLLVQQSGRQTSRKSRLMASHQQVLRYDRETKSDLDPATEQQLLAAVLPRLAQYQAILLSDYGKGVLTPAVCQALIGQANQLGTKVLIDPKGHDYRKYHGAYLVTPNRKEAATATGLAINPAEAASLQAAGQYLRQQFGLAYAVITLSEAGMAYFGPTEWQHLPTRARDVYDVTGAGDTVLAALGFALAQGRHLAEACHFANYAAAVVVGKVGSATATLAEIEEMAGKSQGEGSEHLLKTRAQMAALAQQLRQRGKKLVFTNGCFDVLHLGHVKYLEKAKTFGDVLIVGVNADASVRRLKGPERPINPEQDRAYLLAALGTVDYVVVFDEDTPYALIQALRPDVLVKGGDYADKPVVGSDLVPEVRLVDFVEGRSSTRVIQKIKAGGDTEIQ
ncbi:MAG: D-glycero-beta-D-manno-heptose-7-phosphate kinase [Bernardetiaceae bacterium]|nr:D-glycero-beta-D-manno-heptose-7-phosphate kinase [Bernardetiaceae bacterium]